MPLPGTRVFERLPVFTVEPSTLTAFALAALFALAATAVRLAIGAVDPAVPPYATFLVATMLTSILAGAAAGIACAAVGLLLAHIAFAAMVPTAFGWGSYLQYALLSGLIVWVADEYRGLLRRLQDREKTTERQMRLIQAENHVLTLIAADTPLPETLGSLVRTIQEYSENRIIASVLLLDDDGKHLRHCAAPDLPEEYNQAIDGLAIGPDVGSCGTAAYRAEPVYVTDIATDPLWTNFRQLASQYDLAACWSTPIISRAKTVLGTFALYSRQPRAPQPHEIQIVALLVKIAALAIERHRGREQRQLLMQEMSHRMKNSLAVVGSIAASTLRQHVEDSKYVDFEKRLAALGQVQTLLTESHWQGIALSHLVRNIAIEPFRGSGERFHIAGPNVHLPVNLTLPFAMAIHELCTNAVKYGALSREDGTVEISWGFLPKNAPEQFYLKWKECGARLWWRQREWGSERG